MIITQVISKGPGSDISVGNFLALFHIDQRF